MTVSHLKSFHVEFLNAQYRFVMKPTGDYTVHFADPDMYVLKDLIAKLRLIRVEVTFSGRISCRSSFHDTQRWKLQQASTEIKQTAKA